tara:strand:+ start:6171 stop:6401 length:231 start_codon:yes stop_codon:yes gene_type:complete
MDSVTIPVAALITAVGTLLFAVYGMKRKANGDYVTRLERRIEKLEKQLSDSQDECNRLQIENIRLMRQLLKANGVT